MDINPKTTTVRELVTAAREAAAKGAAEQQAVIEPVKTETAPIEEKAKPVDLKVLKAGASPTMFYAIGASVNLDLDGEMLAQKSMVTMAHDFTAGDRVFKANHAEETEMDLVESMTGVPIVEENGALRTLKSSETVTDAMNVVGIDFKADATHWIVGLRPKDSAIMEAAKAGEIAGVSWSAYVTKTEV
jgi:hypothetical protein